MKLPLVLTCAATSALLVLCGVGTSLLGGWSAVSAACTDTTTASASAPATTSGSPTASMSTVSASAAASPGPACPTGTWTQPVHASVVSGFRTRPRPTHNGVDLGAARYTPIRAASTGVVIVARCDASTGDCDHDGSPSTPGCGWFVDLRHPGDIITRYCHMASRPAVGVGDTVTVGQIIGVVGSSGHSSGPHLHFEVHLHGDRSASAAVDPIPFMQSVGAPLR